MLIYPKIPRHSRYKNNMIASEPFYFAMVDRVSGSFCLGSAAEEESHSG